MVNNLKANVMKKLISIVLIIVLSTMGLTAQERDRDRIQDQDRTNLMMVNGEMLQLRDRAEMRLKKPLRLKDGTEINSNGIYTTKEGKQFKLQNGECMDNDGIKYRNEYQYRFKVQQENKGLTQAQIQERNENRYYITMINDEMYQIRNRSQNRLEQQLNLADGSTINPDGMIQTRDRKELRLRDGECINMDGHVHRNMYEFRKMQIHKGKKAIKKKLPIKQVVKSKKKKVKV